MQGCAQPRQGLPLDNPVQAKRSAGDENSKLNRMQYIRHNYSFIFFFPQFFPRRGGKTNALSSLSLQIPANPCKFQRYDFYFPAQICGRFLFPIPVITCRHSGLIHDPEDHFHLRCR
jgi:hypothetical protein